MLELGQLKSPDANDAHIVNIVDWLLEYASTSAPATSTSNRAAIKVTSGFESTA